VTLTTADSGCTDTADALSNCIEHGYTSAQKGRKSVLANAFLGELTSAQKNAEKSQKSGDSYVLIATEVGTVKTMNAVSIPSQTSITEPQVIRSTSDPIFVDTILPEHMHVLILLPETASADHKSVYTQLFANIAPEVQYSFNFT
jgi:hypothetical protein